MKGKYAIAGLALVLLSLALAWPDDAVASSPQGLVSQPAPAFSEKDTDGKLVTLDEYRGKVVLLNFWGTWCPPCKAEVPAFERLAGRAPREPGGRRRGRVLQRGESASVLRGFPGQLSGLHGLLRIDGEIREGLGHTDYLHHRQEGTDRRHCDRIPEPGPVRGDDPASSDGIGLIFRTMTCLYIFTSRTIGGFCPMAIAKSLVATSSVCPVAPSAATISGGIVEDPVA